MKKIFKPILLSTMAIGVATTIVSCGSANPDPVPTPEQKALKDFDSLVDTFSKESQSRVYLTNATNRVRLMTSRSATAYNFASVNVWFPTDTDYPYKAQSDAFINEIKTLWNLPTMQCILLKFKGVDTITGDISHPFKAPAEGYTFVVYPMSDRIGTIIPGHTLESAKKIWVDFSFMG